MYPETKPILTKFPLDIDKVELFPIHDLHFGHECFDMHRWNVLRDYILAEPNRMVAFVGDLIECAYPGTKGNPMTTVHPADQRDFLVELFRTFKDRCVGILVGNHEDRTNRLIGTHILYDCACIAGCSDKFRTTYAMIDLMVGCGRQRHPDQQFQYVGFMLHHAKDLKSFSTADALEGFDFLLYGHDHDPRDHARAKICYIRGKHMAKFTQVETINCGSFLNYGGYGAMGGYRPLAPKLYKLILDGTQHSIQTVGFYV